ncbi:putative RNA methyltransferase [uncultured Arthrobacter sp.]|uniref:putative RNA methyltransferase n=1 Tax=uncultured Arthrobacter sp. TaxID=114050 RepID=UPI002616A659|nr:methyltransferase domain-containing protein [uncultured Arthrobacter sp.]
MSALPRTLLVCPVCGEPLTGADRGLACPRGHRYDRARQGYVNLLTGKGSPFTGDTAGMVDAREAFLRAGHYDPLRSALVAAARTQVVSPGVVLDAGAGTGYYLEGVVGAWPAAFPVALDISKTALRRAARALPGGISILWDLWRSLPLSDGSVDLLLNVFAPRNPAEFARVLAPGGCAVVVTPRPGHLAGLELVGPLLAVPEQKADDVVGAFEGLLVEVHREELDYVMTLPQDLARSALAMGPAAHHASSAPSPTAPPAAPPAATSGPDAELRVDARFTVQVLARDQPARASWAPAGQGTEE